MADFTEIIQEINTNLPDNNTQSITAAKLRTTLIDLTNTIDTQQDNFESTVNTSLSNIVVDNLTSTDTDKALSANQGNVLNKYFTDITQNKNATVIVTTTFTGSTRWYPNTSQYTEAEQVKMPQGCVIRNLGNSAVNLYVTNSTSAEHTLLAAGATLTADKDYNYIRESYNATGHDMKLFIYADADIPNLVGQVSTLNTTVTGLQSTMLTQTDIADNLTTDSSTKALSAKQGVKINGILFDGYNDTVTHTTTGNWETIGHYTYINAVGGSYTGETVNTTNWYTVKLNVTAGKTVHYSVRNVATSGAIGAAFVANGSVVWRLDVDFPNPTTNSSTNYEGTYTPTVDGIFILNTTYKSVSEAYWTEIAHIEGLEPRITELENEVNTISEELGGTSIQQITSRLWNGYKTISQESLAYSSTDNPVIKLSDYPKALKKGDKLVLEASVSGSWGDGITIGKIATSSTNNNGGFTAARAIIDSTQIKIQINNGSTSSPSWVSQGTALTHNLTIETYVKVIIDIEYDKWKFILQTLTDTFTGEITCPYNNGLPTLYSNEATLSNIKFSATNEDFSKAIWMFGDSYFGIYSSDRELYYLNQWGYLNCLVQGFGGQSSTGGLADFQRCLSIGKPKYVVFAEGMNDNSGLSGWQTNIETVMNLCEENGITLILTTIPKVISTTYKNKEEMTAYVRQSGYRYIDVTKAVGSNSNGEWYGNGENWNYLSTTDNVHPTSYGAKAIATQFLIDFPELMQY